MASRNNKIFMIISSLGGGGAERVFARLANYLSENHEVFLYQLLPKEKSYALSDNVHLVGPDMYKKNRIVSSIIGFIRRIGAIYNARVKNIFFNQDFQTFRYDAVIFISKFRLRERPSVILSFLELPNQFLASSLGPGCKVMSERSNPQKKDSGYMEKMCHSYSRADKVIFQSEAVREMFPAGIREKGVVLPNPVSITCKAKGGSGKIVNVGRLHQQKNQASLIRAFSRFLPSHPSYTLHIYGDGDLRDELEILIRDLSLEGKVFLEGNVDEVHEAIADAQMFVFSSDYEGMPNALLEAMMMGLPCVSTSFYGADEFFGDSGAVEMVPVGDEEALAQAMGRLSDDDPFRSELAKRGEEFALRFSADRVLPLWEKELFNSQ
ncbi:MAG: glycosyltransferase [Bacteroidales bacterium]|nr:glycosyltransferase [Bacteroidales bacterium]